jgi:hypothetical protein
MDKDTNVRRLLTSLTAEDTAVVHFKRTDGKTVSFTGVRVDSIGPSAENPGVVGVEFVDTDRLVHLPFIESWEIEYL